MLYKMSLIKFVFVLWIDWRFFFVVNLWYWLVCLLKVWFGDEGGEVFEEKKMEGWVGGCVGMK